MSDADNTEKTTRTETRPFLGGEVSYEIDGLREGHARSLATKMDTAIEMALSRAFNHEPREKLGPRRADTEWELPAIQDAVDAVNDSGTFGDNFEGDVAYAIEEGYYPEEWTHYVDLTDVETDGLQTAFSTTQSELVRRGYGINSIRTDDEGRVTKLHVISLSWFYDARSHGKQKFGDGGRDE